MDNAPTESFDLCKKKKIFLEKSRKGERGNF